MDTALKEDVKSKLSIFHDEILREAVDTTYWQLSLKRDGWVVQIRQKENDQFCEVCFACNYQGDDLVRFQGLIQDQIFLLELRKLLISPKIYWYTDQTGNEISGYFVIQRCIVQSDNIDISDLDEAIRSVINYGTLALFFIALKIRKNAEQQSTDLMPAGSDENKSYF